MLKLQNGSPPIITGVKFIPILNKWSMSFLNCSKSYSQLAEHILALDVQYLQFKLQRLVIIKSMK